MLIITIWKFITLSIYFYPNRGHVIMIIENLESKLNKLFCCLYDPRNSYDYKIVFYINIIHILLILLYMFRDKTLTVFFFYLISIMSLLLYPICHFEFILMIIYLLLVTSIVLGSIFSYTIINPKIRTIYKELYEYHEI